MTDDLPALPASRPLWLVTLADLALLLVGFLVLVQATANRDALARSLRARFGAPVEVAMPVAASATGFARGSAALGDSQPLIAWARDALADPRVTVTITGASMPEEAGVLLAADRARAVAAALVAAGLPADRLILSTDRAPLPRATLTLAFAGDRSSR